MHLLAQAGLDNVSVERTDDWSDHYDGSARWYDLRDMTEASTHAPWGDPNGAQLWAFE